MTRVWLLAPIAVATAMILPLACSEDEPASGTQTSSPTSNVASSTTSATTGGGGTPGTGGTAQGGNPQGGMAPGGGNIGGASMDNCSDCTDELENGACMAEFDACDQVPDDICKDWFDCYKDCIDNDFTAACFMACDTNAPTEATALKACMCANCSNACTPFCP